MKRERTALLFLLVAVLGMSFVFSVRAQPAEAARKPTLEETAQALADAIAEAFVTDDPAPIVEFYADDATAWYPGGTAPVVGEEANLAAWVGGISVFETHPVSVDTVTVAKAGDIGYATGRWTATAPGMEPLTGRYINTWRRNGDRWELTVLSVHFHTDVAPLE
jgi:ketosteroid isomerase-like protein